MDEFLFEDTYNDDLPRIPVRMMKVAIYSRKSNETEGRSKSQSQQEEHALETCEHYKFLPENIEVYHEPEGVKGEWWWKDDEGRNPGPDYRPELTRLIRDIKAGRINVVVVWKSDRLYRDPEVCSAIIRIFKQYNVRYISGRWLQDLNSAEGAYQTLVDAAANRKYRDRISEDIRRDLKWKASHGMFSRDPSCLGFRSAGLKSQSVTPIWEEIEVVRRIFRLYVLGENGSGPMGDCEIARYCREHGIRVTSGAKKQKAKYDNRVEASQIGSILTNCMYAGRWRHAGREYQCDKLLLPAQDGSDRLEPVVPVALYEAAQERRRLRQQRGKRSLNTTHLLSGLMVCARCGRSLHVAGKYDGLSPGEAPKNRYWRCRWSKHGQCAPYGMKMVQESVTDEWVVKELAPIIAAEIRDMRSAAGRDADVQKLADIERHIREASDTETRKLRDVLQVLDSEQYGRLAAQLRAERQSLERQASEIRRRLESLEVVAPDLTEDLSALPKSALKDALTRYIRWIALGKEGVVVYTRIGAYIAARFKKVRTPGKCGAARLAIDTPRPDAALECLSWFPEPRGFVQGRRDMVGAAAETLTDEEILPGAFGEPTASTGEIEVTYERLDEAS